MDHYKERRKFLSNSLGRIAEFLATAAFVGPILLNKMNVWIMGGVGVAFVVLMIIAYSLVPQD